MTSSSEIIRLWGGSALVEINQVSKRKSRGKGQKGKSPQKGKGKDKGKSKDAKGKGKGKSQQSGQKLWFILEESQAKTTDVNRSNYFGAFGHWNKDCRKFQADKASSAVRQGEGDEKYSQHVASSRCSTGTAQKSPSATSYRSTMVHLALVWLEIFKRFFLELVNLTSSHFHHMRTVTSAGSNSVDIILDSGADTSACRLLTLMLVNHAVIKQRSSLLMLRVASWISETPGLATVDLGKSRCLAWMLRAPPSSKGGLKGGLRGLLEGRLKGSWRVPPLPLPLPWRVEALKGRLKGGLKGALKGGLKGSLRGALKGGLEGRLKGSLKRGLKGALRGA